MAWSWDEQFGPVSPVSDRLTAKSFFMDTLGKDSFFYFWEVLCFWARCERNQAQA